MYEIGTIIGDPNWIFHKIIQNDAILNESGQVETFFNDVVLKQAKRHVSEVFK